MESYERIVPDTSVIIDGLLSHLLGSTMKADTIIIHEAVMAELQHQASQNRTMGFLGLREIQRLRELSKKLNFTLEFAGRRPNASEIEHAGLGEIDALIGQYAFESDALLVTADKVQNQVSLAKGAKVVLLDLPVKEKIQLDSYFDKQTMSVHLREGTTPKAKKGKPGEWEFVELAKKLLTQDDVREVAQEIIEAAAARSDGFVEIDRPGSTIIQLGSYRIVITKPPFSDGWEITAVRPVKRLSMDDYKLADKLKERIGEQAEGILIAGAPGQGKSTFAQALAEFYLGMNKVIKTVEAPRDLILPEAITQYAISHGTPEEVHDILLLSRPDYTIFDEMRNTKDFMLFTDLRLSGIGLIGVVHATKAVDAIQRFVGRIELGVIPQVVDTVIFIQNGMVGKVLSLSMQVKVPAGMTEADLARPIVVVTDFLTNKPEYELYSYGEETVVVPVKGESAKPPAHRLASAAVEDFFLKYSDRAQAEVVSDNKAVVRLPADCIARVIGKGGENIQRIEEALGISIDIEELQSSGSVKKNKNAEGQATVSFRTKMSKRMVEFFPDVPKGNSLNIYVDGDFLMSAKVSNNGAIKIRKDHKMGKLLTEAVEGKADIKLTRA